MDTNSIISETVSEMLSILQNGLKDKFPKVATMVVDFLASKKERLTYIAEARLGNKIDNEFMTDALKTEITILKDELLAVGVATASVLESLANELIDKFTSVILGNITPLG